ncbi:MAG: alpha/beta fold hydrolase [Deltaproteobacteria bacterium]|nr:alpha/beta fold hydrolase [Deltaproteobacteria bacterium]
MWFRANFRRFQTKLRHLATYFRTLNEANEVERKTDLENCSMPVLVLHGFGATRRSLSILEARLRKDGFGVFSIRLGGFLDLFNTAPIDELAIVVAKKVEELCQRFQCNRIAIIGYSKGGLIGRYYVNFLHGDHRVHTLITLATPNQGNRWALLSNLLIAGLFSKGLRQLRSGSSFLKKMNNTPHPNNIYMVSISSYADTHCPPAYCRLPHTENSNLVFNIILDDLLHSDFIIKQKAYNEIAKHLQAGFKRYNDTL